MSRPRTRGRRTQVVPTIQNTKLGKEEKRKKICGSYLSLALHASLASYSEFWTSCLRPKCQVPKVRTVTNYLLLSNSKYLLYIYIYRTKYNRSILTLTKNFAVQKIADSWILQGSGTEIGLFRSS
jgi:hypothetical protein